MLPNNSSGSDSAPLLPESKPLEDVRPDECVEIWWLEQLRRQYASVHGYLGLAVCLFGVLSNLVNIVVLTRRHMRSSTNILLCALAIANAAKMLSFIPVYAHFYLAHAEDVLFLTRSDQWIHYLLVQITLGIMLHTAALYITISIAVFRYLYIRYPIKGVHFCSMHNSVIVILLATALSALISMPNILCNDIVHIDYSADSGVNDTGEQRLIIYTISPTVTWPFVQDMNMWIQSIFIRFVPCFGLTLFTALLIFEIRKAKVRRYALKRCTVTRESQFSARRDNDSTTTMLLAVVVMFLAVEFPQGVMAVANYISLCFYGKVYMALGDLIDLVTLSNNAVNFIIYTTMSRQFRQSFVRIFWTSWTGRHEFQCSNHNARTFQSEAVCTFYRDETAIIRSAQRTTPR